MKRIFLDHEGETIRVDLGRAAMLAVLAAFLWCSIYHRWTPESWRTPLTYLSDPEKGDAIGFLAAVKVAQEGHFSLFEFTNIPELGAPNVANWDDFPIVEKPLYFLTGLLARFIGVFAAANAAVMLGQLLAAVSFYAACRLLNGDRVWSFAAALVFAFSRYAFAHGLHHITVAYDWHVPLDLVVCYWLMRGKGIGLRERRFGFALAIAFVTGVQNIYYSAMFVQLIFLGGLLQAWRGGWRKALPAIAIIGTVAGALLLMNLNLILYHIIHGPDPGAVTRDYRWLEVYGLKLVDLVVPPPDHAFPPFAAWGAAHLKEVVLPSGETPPTAYLGLIGLAAMAWLVIVSWRRAVSRVVLPLEAFLILWIILFSNVGGLNSILGVLGFQLLRTTTRYSIFIMAIVLMYAVQRLSLIKFRIPMVAFVFAVLALVIAWWDQTPPRVTDQDLQEIASKVASDRDFTEKMEQKLPANAMVFQLPVMDFPESPASGVGSYDHFRPYLYSQKLRFSFGAEKGRPAADWQHQLVQQSFGDVIMQLEGMGFAAIYLNRNGVPDKGASMIKALNEMGYGNIIESRDGDLVCIFLQKG
jgi:hypothetical protein